MVLIAQGLFAFASVFCVSIILKSPKSSLILNAFIGTIGWLIHLSTKPYLSFYLSIFLASISIMLLSHLAARKFKYPTTLFIITCHFLFVPGEAIYKAVYSLVFENSHSFNYYVQHAFLVSGTIALSIFIVDSLFSLIPSKK